MIDCFCFMNELDLLEIRLNSLAPYVDKFVLCEATHTMTGAPKTLVFEANKDRFRDFNITHLIVKDFTKKRTVWGMYWDQMEAMQEAIKDVPDDEIVLLSDVDEIPDLKHYRGQEGAFRHRMYYYYFNVYMGIPMWKGTIATKKKNITSFKYIRIHRKRIEKIPRCRGWHFSFVSSPEGIIEKIEAFAHQELNTPEIKANVAENYKNLIDPFGRSTEKFIVEMPSGPEWLLENKDKYKHLFYGE